MMKKPLIDTEKTIFCNTIITGRQFLECYTGSYYIRADTLNEVKNCLYSRNLSSRAVPISEIFGYEGQYILVQFSKEEDYTEYEYYFMSVRNSHINRFTKRLKEMLE